MSIRPSRSLARGAGSRGGRVAVALGVAVALALLGAGTPTAAAPPIRIAVPASAADQTEVALPDGSRALVGTDGEAMVLGADGTLTMRRLRGELAYGPSVSGTVTLSQDQLVAELLRPPLRPYAPDQVVATFRAGIEVTPAAAPTVPGAPPVPAAFTGDESTNEQLASIGARSVERLFAAADSDGWRAARDAAEQATGASVLDLGRTYLVRIDGPDPREAAAALLALPTVEWASPAWTVTAPPSSGPRVPPEVAAAAAASAAVSTDDAGPVPVGTQPAPVGTQSAPAGAAAPSLPTNYGLRSNAQSHWNSPGLNAVAAYHHVVKSFGELPGTGEIITTVGVGPLTSDPTGPCAGDVGFFGPTTTVIGDQRYVDMPSMPLIPTYTATASGALDPLGEVCTNRDPMLADVGLALSVMSPLPHNRQRPEAPGSGLTDLLGLAPGASYRLVVPGSGLPTIVDLAGALLGAAQQSPPPSVINASAHIGGEDVGFPNRYLEDDPLLRSVITTIVASDISVAVAAGDGTTTYRYAAFGPSGGGNRIDVAPPGTEPTRLNDIALSTAPSQLPDSGAIAVGATTLNDVFAVPPHGTDDLARRAQQTYPAVRWTGSTEFASGYGDRVDLAAPADSIVSFQHQLGGGARDVSIQLGTSTTAAAAQVAAAIAVVRQVARLTDQPLTDPADIRELLVDTGSAVPEVPQALHPVHVGPQLNLGAAVEELLARAGEPIQPGVVRVAVGQRRPVASDGAIFETWTDRDDIDLAGPLHPGTGEPTGRNARAWITIAPDWVGLPDDTTYTLRVEGRDAGLLASTKSARVLPEQIFASVGLPLAAEEPRTLSLNYVAADGSDVLATARTTLTFGPATGNSRQVHAPLAAAVVTGATIPVRYDLRGTVPLGDEPELVVSYPGRVKPPVGPPFVPALRIPLPELHGRVDVPVSALEGGGVYGLGLHYADEDMDGFLVPLYSDFGFVRVAPVPVAQPPAPLVSASRSGARRRAGYSVQISDGADVRVQWDASGVPGATSALLEVSAAGPTIGQLRSTFNNPEGTQRDDDGLDTGSVALLQLPSVSGTTVLSAAELELYSAMSHGLRVLPVGSGGAVVGHASPVSTVTMNGVRPRGDGTLQEGYGVDMRSGRGYLTATEYEPTGPVSSVQTFDTATMKVTDVPLPPASDTLYRALGAGVFGDHVGLVQERGGAPEVPTGHWALPGVGAHPVKEWSSPRPARYTLERAGSDPSDERGVFLLRDQDDAGSGPFRLVTGDVRANTFDRIRDVSGPLEGLPAAPEARVVAYDSTGADVAGLAFSPDPFVDPIIELVDPRTGEIRVLDMEATGMPMGMDLMGPARKVGLTTLDQRLTVGDVDTGQSTTVAMPDGDLGFWVTADDGNRLFLVAQAGKGDNGVDKNGLSAIHVLDEDLQLVATLRRFNLYDTPLAPWVNQIQVDPRTRTGYFVGPLQAQLAVFSY